MTTLIASFEAIRRELESLISEVERSNPTSEELVTAATALNQVRCKHLALDVAMRKIYNRLNPPLPPIPIPPDKPRIVSAPARADGPAPRAQGIF